MLEQFKNISIKNKILILVFFVIISYFLYVSIYFSIREKKILINNLREEAIHISEIIAYSVAPGLSFMDKDVVEKTFESVKTLSDLSFMIVYDNSGKIFSAYNIKASGNIDYNKIIKNKILYKNKKMIIVQPIKSRKMQVGYLISGFELKTINKNIKNNIMINLIILFIALIIAITLLYSLTVQTISKPIIQFADKVRSISTNSDLNQSVTISSKDEIGGLAHSFNNMIASLKNATVSKEYVNNIIKSMTDTLIVVNLDGKIERLNRATYKLLGYKRKELLGKPMDMIIGRNNWFTKTCINELSKSKFIENIEKFYYTKNNKKIPVSFSASIMIDSNNTTTGFVCVAKDITQLKNSEKKLKQAYKKLKQFQAQIVQSEKMVGIGQLAAGVAHEINNPTAYIINNLQILQKYIPDIFNTFNKLNKIFISLLPKNKKESEKIIQQWEKIKERSNLDYIKQDLSELANETLTGAERIKNIVANLMDFAHPNQEEFNYIDINREIDKSINLVWNEMKYICKIQKEFKKLPKILCNPGQLSQVFVILFINALQAIEHKKGIIKIKTSLKKESINIEIIDNGHGIQQKHINKIFEPFFTTKDVGKGTGLGLSIAYGIIKNHKGSIHVESIPGKETKFTIKLPVITKQNNIT